MRYVSIKKNMKNLESNITGFSRYPISKLGILYKVLKANNVKLRKSR